MKFLVLLVALFALIGCHENSIHSKASSRILASEKTPVTVSQNNVTQSSVCPEGMVLIDGEYCPKVQENCLYYVDIYGNKIPPGKIPEQTGRCGEFQNPTRCLSPTVHKKFCIDKYELPNVEGQIPTSWLSYDDSKKMCESVGKRLCTASEWEFSCEGPTPDPHPYPYGDGYHRDSKACNTDNPLRHDINISHARHKGDPDATKLDAMLIPSGSRKTCVSPFGVYDLVGNLDEWVLNDNQFGYKTGLKGGHVWGVRARCRPMTTGHNGSSPSYFTWYETSSRCCLTP